MILFRIIIKIINKRILYLKIGLKNNMDKFFELNNQQLSLFFFYHYKRNIFLDYYKKTMIL